MGFNKQLKNLLLASSCSLIIGDRGSGKSTLMALGVKAFQSRGLAVYSNYPYRDCFSIPFSDKTIGKVKMKVVDKSWLYNTDLSDSLVIIDEAKTVWNARAYTSWTESDEELFNFIRKHNTTFMLATQSYDGVDLNIKRACDYTFFVQQSRFFKNFSTVEVSKQCQLKIADKNTQVVSRGYTKNAMKVTWEIGEIPVAFSHFWRKPYYGDFETLYTTDEKDAPVNESWNLLLDGVK